MSTIIAKAREIIAEQHALIAKIQDACSHPVDALSFEYGSDTGNWDRNEDSYWTTYTCGLCEKRWSEDGSNQLPRCHRDER